jgi:hypothetical protein
MSEDKGSPRLEDYLSHMLEAVQLAREYVQGVGKDIFSKTAALSRRLF